MGKKKDEKKWLQVGNFLVGIDTNAHGSYVVLKSVSQNWSIRWREDTLMFGMLIGVMKQAVDNDGAREYLHSLAAIMFAATTYLHDLVALSTLKTMPFCEGIVKLLKEQQEFEESIKGPSGTQEDDEAALNEVAEMARVQDALESLGSEPDSEAEAESLPADVENVNNDIEPVSDEVLNG